MAGKRPNMLSLRQSKLLSALAHQPTLQLACAETGVGERTATRWLSEDANFRAEFRQIKQEIVGNAVYQLQKATNNAVNVLLSLMNDPETPASVRFSSAKAILELALQGVKLDEALAGNPIDAGPIVLKVRYDPPNGYKNPPAVLDS
jgi:hypothetical protein